MKKTLGFLWTLVWAVPLMFSFLLFWVFYAFIFGPGPAFAMAGAITSVTNEHVSD